MYGAQVTGQPKNEILPKLTVCMPSARSAKMSQTRTDFKVQESSTQLKKCVILPLNHRLLRFWTLQSLGLMSLFLFLQLLIMTKLCEEEEEMKKTMSNTRCVCHCL